MHDFERLKALLRQRQAVAWEAVDSLGLLLPSVLRPSDYRQTPEGCIPFAHTGGDGAHFSFAGRGSAVADSCPVVMTAPMCFDAPNLVVGETLREFLALGLQTGYFVLPELLHDRDRWLGILTAGHRMPGLHPAEIDTLDAIATEFRLVPWPDPAARLAALNADHADLRDPAGG